MYNITTEHQTIGYKLKQAGQNLSLYQSVIGLIALLLLGAIFSDRFLTVNNLINLLRQAPIIGFMALSLTLVIISGGTDLSVDGTLALSAVMAALYIPQLGVVPTIVMCVSIGAVIGLVNGFIITHWKLEPFVVTLGMQTITRGLAFIATGGRTIFNPLPPSFQFLANGHFFGVIPAPFVFMFLTYFFMYLVMKYTAFGRYIYFLGGNEEACRLAGIKTSLQRVLIFMLSGIFASIAGLFHLSRVNAGDPTAATGQTLMAIACVIIGGNSFSGGKGNVWLTLVGLMIITMIFNIMNLLGISFYYQLVAQGVIVITSVVLSKQQL